MMSTEISPDASEDNNEANALIRQNGFYWVRLNDDWFLVEFNSRENLFYFPGHFEGFDSRQIQEIDERVLHKKFEGYKKKGPDMRQETKSVRPEGYYWVMHDAMWFAAYYRPSEDEFYFPGQAYGFEASDLEEIDEQRIER